MSVDEAARESEWYVEHTALLISRPLSGPY